MNSMSAFSLKIPNRTKCTLITRMMHLKHDSYVQNYALKYSLLCAMYLKSERAKYL